MSWKKTSSILNARINHHGLGSMVAAGQVCMEAERLMPGVFKAVSCRNGVLHLQLAKADLKAFKMQEGKLLDELAAFTAERRLPPVTRLRLSFEELSALPRPHA